MTDDEIRAARERCEKATGRPWEVGGPWPTVSVIVCVDGGSAGHYDAPEPPMYEPICIVQQSTDFKTPPHEQAVKDAQFIAHSRTDLPKALDEIDRLRKEIEKQKVAHNGAYKND